MILFVAFTLVALVLRVCINSIPLNMEVGDTSLVALVLWGCFVLYIVYSIDLVGFSFQPIEKEGDMFKRLCQYVKNTHAATHQQYTLDVLDVSFKYLYNYSQTYHKHHPRNHVLNKKKSSLTWLCNYILTEASCSMSFFLFLGLKNPNYACII